MPFLWNVYSLTTKTEEMSGIFSSHKALYPGGHDFINSTILSPSLVHIRLQVHSSVKAQSVTQYSFHFTATFTYVDGRLLLVSSEDPDFDIGPHQSGDGLGHAGLETVLYGRGAQQH